MDPKASRVHPQQALAVYAESLASGGTVAFFGDASLGLGARLVELGARSVVVWDPDPGRAGLEGVGAPEGVTVAAYPSLGQGAQRRVDVALIGELGLFDDPRELLARVAGLVGDDGVLLLSAANREVGNGNGARAFEYYELFDLVAAHFNAVTMVGELSFHGIALVALGEEDESPAVSVDTQLAGGARVPERFVVVASQREVGPQPYTVVELPGASWQASTDLEVAQVALRAQIARTEQVEALLRDREREQAELSSRLEALQTSAHTSAQASGAVAAELREASRRAETTEARAATYERELGQLSEANAVEIRRFEDMLRERAQATRSLEIELARRDQMVRDLVETLEEARVAPLPEPARPAPDAPAPAPADSGFPRADLELSEENGRLRELLDAMALDVARREAEATAAAWTVSELERRLKTASTPAAPAAGVAPDTNSR
jgi:hypothetical protein